MNIKKKISKLPKEVIDERSQVLNPNNIKYYLSRVKGLTKVMARKIIELKGKKKITL